MTSTRHSGRSPMSMVSFWSWECSDQVEASEGIKGSQPDACRAFRVPFGGPSFSFIARLHPPRKRVIQYAAALPYADGPQRIGYPAFAGYDRESRACVPGLLAP